MADYSLSADIIGAKELENAIKDIGSVTQRAIIDALNKTAYQLQARAMENAPHKTGALQGSLHVEQEPGHLARVEGDNIEAAVGTNLEYARAQEHGTVGMTIHSRSRTGKPFSYIGNIKPKKYMKRAKDETGTDYMNNMRDALAIITRYLANA